MWVQQRQGAVCEWRRGVEGIQGARSPAPSGGSRSCGDASAATPCPWSCPLLLPNQATLGGDGSPLLPFPGRHCPSLVLNSARHSGGALSLSPAAFAEPFGHVGFPPALRLAQDRGTARAGAIWVCSSQVFQRGYALGRCCRFIVCMIPEHAQAAWQYAGWAGLGDIPWWARPWIVPGMAGTVETGTEVPVLLLSRSMDERRGTGTVAARAPCHLPAGSPWWRGQSWAPQLLHHPHALLPFSGAWARSVLGSKMKSAHPVLLQGAALPALEATRDSPASLAGSCPGSWFPDPLMRPTFHRPFFLPLALQTEA